MQTRPLFSVNIPVYPENLDAILDVCNDSGDEAALRLGALADAREVFDNWDSLLSALTR